jgi:hypothetical protein
VGTKLTLMGVLAVLAVAWPAASSPASDGQDLVFIHHSCGRDWLSRGLDDALLAKDYVDERNDISYGTLLSPDPGRYASLDSVPGDHTDMCHWILWFNDYLDGVKAHQCADGFNRIIMFKSCYPASNLSTSAAAGDPFSGTKTIANYQAVYRHPDGPGGTYTRRLGGTDYLYRPLEDIFAAHPEVLFVPVTAPPLCFGCTTDERGHNARLFNDWLKNDWLAEYDARHPGLHNVAVFDWFDVLAYGDDHASHPNRLRAEYGGTSGDSHPNEAADVDSTAVFATDPDSFLDAAWGRFVARLPGDADLDGDVDLADYHTGRGHFGAAGGATWAEGDTDADGDVDFTDYAKLKETFGWSVLGRGPAPGRAAPEPSAAMLLLLGLPVVAGRRRR